MSTFKSINAENIAINSKDISNHIYDDYYGENAWCYDKYSNGLLHVYRNADPTTCTCTKKYGSLYYADVKEWNINIPNTKIVKVCSYVTSIDANNNNGLYWISNKSLIIQSNGSVDWAWFVVSAQSTTQVLNVYFSGWFKYTDE